MIIAVTKIRFNRMEETAVANTAVGVGEIVLTTDTGRLLIGTSPTDGNPYHDRNTFPFAYREILTETSPRTRELLAQANRSQTRWDFFYPVELKPGEWFVPLSHTDGGYGRRMVVDNPSFSTTIEYLITRNDISGNKKVAEDVLEIGSLRLLSNGTLTTQTQTSTLGGSSLVAFSVVWEDGKSFLKVDQTYGDTINFQARITTISE